MMAYRNQFGPISAFGPAVILVLFVVAGFAQAATWNVPGDSATIQGGIDLASYGDTVEVAAGTYTELITLKNGVALIGAGASTTTIDVNNAGSVITSSSCGTSIGALAGKNYGTILECYATSKVTGGEFE